MEHTCIGRDISEEKFLSFDWIIPENFERIFPVRMGKDMCKFYF